MAMFFPNEGVRMQKWSHFILCKQFSDKNNIKNQRCSSSCWGIVLFKNFTQRKFNFVNIGHFNWTEAESWERSRREFNFFNFCRKIYFILKIHPDGAATATAHRYSNNTLIHSLNFLRDFSWKINFILKIEFILPDWECPEDVGWRLGQNLSIPVPKPRDPASLVL